MLEETASMCTEEEKMVLPCSLIKLVKTVGYCFSSSSVIHFSQIITFFSVSKNMLTGCYSCLVANHMVYILDVALWVFGPALVHPRGVRREDKSCSTWQKLEVSKWHQVTAGMCAGGAEVPESHEHLGHLHKAVSFITCPTACPGCTPPRQGDSNKKKKPYAPMDTVCTHLYCKCFSRGSG